MYNMKSCSVVAGLSIFCAKKVYTVRWLTVDTSTSTTTVCLKEEPVLLANHCVSTPGSVESGQSKSDIIQCIHIAERYNYSSLTVQLYVIVAVTTHGSVLQ